MLLLAEAEGLGLLMIRIYVLAASVSIGYPTRVFNEMHTSFF
jgi:hypothetical protein